MTLKKPLLLLGFAGLATLGGLYCLKQSLHAPKQRPEHAKRKTANVPDGNELRDGDLVFQTSRSGQSKAIQLATHSEYSHCGLLYKEDGRYFVFEAVQPVKRTAFDKWIARGEGGKFVVKRLKNADQVLTPAVLQQMKQVGERFTGKYYDLTFEWSDEKMYCSELIWKVYKRATGLEIGKLQKLGDFDLTNKIVRKKMVERYGSNIPVNETVISPASIFDSDLLTTVKAD